MARSVAYSDKCYLVWENALSQFRLTRSFEVRWGGKKFTVMRGFLTDLSSIPRVFRSVTPQVGHHLQPSVVHDWLYDYDQGFTRLEADQMMRDGMVLMGVLWLRRQVIYRAVRVAGWTAWGPEKGNQVWRK